MAARERVQSPVMTWRAGVLAIAACAAPRSERAEPPVVAADVAPTLLVAAPVRGTFIEDGTLSVTGRVRDDGPVRVTVNGEAATVGADGAFSARLALAPGMALVETRATDAAGHEASDVRAVLVGPFASTDARALVGARLGRPAVIALGDALAASAKDIDFTAAVRPLNPIYHRRGCLGARVDVEDVAIGAVGVTLAPAPGAIATTVDVDDVVVRLHVRYEVACLGGEAAMTVRTRARVRGMLGGTLAGGRVRTSLAHTSVALDGFRLEIGGLPHALEYLVRPATRPAVEHALATTLTHKLPPLVDGRLAALLAGPPVGTLLGRALAVDVAPRTLEISPTGIVLAGDLAIDVEGATARYPRSDARPPPASDADVDAWISADAINQLLGGLWAARAFEATVALDDLGPLRAVLAAEVHTITLALALPPTVTADDRLELAIGDLLITALDADGGVVQRFAVSLRTTLAMAPGASTLATTEPTVRAQQIGDAGAVAHPLDGSAVEAIVKTAWTVVASQLDLALARVPLPGGKALVLRSVVARGGVLVLGAELRGR